MRSFSLSPHFLRCPVVRCVFFSCTHALDVLPPLSVLLLTFSFQSPFILRLNAKYDLRNFLLPNILFLKKAFTFPRIEKDGDEEKEKKLFPSSFCVCTSFWFSCCFCPIELFFIVCWRVAFTRFNFVFFFLLFCTFLTFSFVTLNGLSTTRGLTGVIIMCNRPGTQVPVLHLLGAYEFPPPPPSYFHVNSDFNYFKQKTQ